MVFPACSFPFVGQFPWKSHTNLPSGKLTYGKSPCSIGKSTIRLPLSPFKIGKLPFSMSQTVSHYQRLWVTISGFLPWHPQGSVKNITSATWISRPGPCCYWKITVEWCCYWISPVGCCYFMLFDCEYHPFSDAVFHIWFLLVKA
jgi:hypothetical protein